MTDFLGASKKIIRDSDPDDLLFAAARLGIAWPNPTIGISIYDQDGELEAVVAYNNHIYDSCHAHIWSNGARRWANKSALRAMFAIPFIANGLSRVWLPIAASNIPSQILALKLGFRFDAKLTGMRDGADEVVMMMTRDECRWIRDD